MPVTTHCHPLIGSILIPSPAQCQPIDGGCQSANSLRGLTGTKSKEAQMLPADNLASPSTRRRKNIQNMAPQLPPIAPGRNCYMGIPVRFQRMELNPHMYYEIGYFVPSFPLPCPPVCNPSTNLAPKIHLVSSCHQLSISLSEIAPGLTTTSQAMKADKAA